MNKILISGCVGYIGSILCKTLIEKNYSVIGLDNFSCSNIGDISPDIDFYEGCISDESLIQKITSKHKIDLVIHLASFRSAEESTYESKKYLDNNLTNSIAFLNSLYLNKVNNIVFASTAAVYGSCQSEDLSEDSKLSPNSPYAESKLKFEKHLSNFNKTHSDFNFITLRLFNVSGSYGELGERHEPETHLIPCAVDALLQNKELNLYGKNFQTKDGTAVRDYVHVLDVASSFINAGNLLIDNKLEFTNKTYNIGSAKTFSNLEIIKLIEKLSDKKLKYKFTKAKAGDLPSLKANNSVAIQAGVLQLGNSSIEKIVKDNLDFRYKYLKN